MKQYRLVMRILSEASTLTGSLFGIFVLSLISANMALLIPIPISLAVDLVLNQQKLPLAVTSWLPAVLQPSSAQLLIFVAVAAGLIILLDMIVGYASWVWQLSVGEGLVLRFRSKLFLKLQKLSILEHDRMGVANLLYRLQYDVPPMQYLTIHGVIPAICSVVMFVLLFTAVFNIDAYLACIALAMAPLIWISIRVHLHRSRQGWLEFKENESSGMTVLQEALANVRVVKAFQQEQSEQRRFTTRSQKALDQQLKIVRIETRMGALTAFFIAVGTGWALFVGVQHAQAGLLTVGELILVIAYTTQLFKPLEALSKNITSIQSALASAERSFEIFDKIPEVAEVNRPARLVQPAADLVFKQVSFGYRKDELILDRLSFAVSRGMHVGISGRTGAGKTTFINLLMRFIDTDAGSIEIDGIDIRSLETSNLREQFSLVQQEPVLFSTSIAENIAYGRPGASIEEIRTAAVAAEADHFISRMPRGYDTVLGERGMNLSGGERQRISLARAYLKRAPILVLDEPTSGLDVDTESRMIKNLREMRKGRTTFIVSHRLALLEGVHLRLHFDGDVIRVIDPGELTTP